MILTVTLNPAVDDTYEVPKLVWGEVNRVTGLHRRPGGKGVNVARILHALGREVLVTGLAGGRTGQAVTDGLASRGVPASFAPIAGETRRTVAVVDGEVTMFTEPGPRVTTQEWQGFLRHYRPLARSARAVVLSGSLPPGVPVRAYAELAREATGPVILDADGDALRHGVAGRPAIAKPNAGELTRATGLTDPAKAAQALRTAGAGTVVASLGAGGVLAVTPDGTLRAALDRPLSGNPTGAGDALVAGLAIGVVEDLPWPDRLTQAVALAAAAVDAPVAGEIETGTLAELVARVRLTPGS